MKTRILNQIYALKLENNTKEAHENVEWVMI